ncbi:hypothetical protein ACP4OV_026213 [Aristida adscensionis]
MASRSSRRADPAIRTRAVRKLSTYVQMEKTLLSYVRPILKTKLIYAQKEKTVLTIKIPEAVFAGLFVHSVQILNRIAKNQSVGKSIFLQGIIRLHPSIALQRIGQTQMMAKLKIQDFHASMSSRASVIDVASSPESLEKNFLGFKERAVYEEALQTMGQEKREEDLPDGVMSVSLLKHQKIALAWMISRENNSHCSGGILADDQGLGKTVSTIALIQKERVHQSIFMTAESDGTESIDDNDETAIAKKESKDCGNQSRPYAASARIAKTVNAQPKKTSASSSASTFRSTSRPAAGTLVVCPASVLSQWANELSAKVTESAKLSVLVYHGGSRTRDEIELAAYDVVVTTYAIVAREVPKENNGDEENNGEIKLTKKMQSKTKKKKKKSNSSDIGPLAVVRWFRVVLDEAHTIKSCQTMAKACWLLWTERRKEMVLIRNTYAK